MQENCEKKQILEGENMKIMKKMQILEEDFVKRIKNDTKNNGTPE